MPIFTRECTSVFERQVDCPEIVQTPSKPTLKFKIGDIVTIKPYSGNSNSTHNVNLSRRQYEEVRLKGKTVIRQTAYSPYNEYGTVYHLEGSEWAFHESVLLKVNQKIRY